MIALKGFTEKRETERREQEPSEDIEELLNEVDEVLAASDRMIAEQVIKHGKPKKSTIYNKTKARLEKMGLPVDEEQLRIVINKYYDKIWRHYSPHNQLAESQKCKSQEQPSYQASLN